MLPSNFVGPSCLGVEIPSTLCLLLFLSGGSSFRHLREPYVSALYDMEMNKVLCYVYLGSRSGSYSCPCNHSWSAPGAGKALFLCTAWCLVSWSGLAKLLPQPGSAQLYGRAPVCVRRCFERFEDSVNALYPKCSQVRRVVVGGSRHSPVAVGTLERLEAVMDAFMNGQGTHNREALPASREVACVRF